MTTDRGTHGTSTPCPRSLGTMLVVAGAAAALAGTAWAQDGNPGDPIAHEFIVRVIEGETIEDVASSYEAVILASFPSHRLYLLGTPAPDPDEGVEAELEIDDRLDSHERNSVNAAAEGHTQSFFVRTAPSGYPEQPIGSMLRLPQAHMLSSGAGVTVAVLDTGIAPHSDLLARLSSGGFNFINGTPTADDSALGLMAGHGTFIAGLIHLVAPQANVLPIAVLDGDGLGTSFTIAEGIYHAMDQGVQVINISLSSPVDSPAVRDAIEAAEAMGIVVVASVGNGISAAPTFPAANAGVIAVAATDLTDHVAPFSDHGPFVVLCGPGVGLVSLLPGDEFGQASGTSFSTALVSGTAALVVSHFPTEEVTSIAQRLERSALDLGSLNQGSNGQLGFGRVRPLQSLQRTRPDVRTTGPR